MKQVRILTGTAIMILLWGLLNSASASGDLKLLLTQTPVPTSSEPAPDLSITHARFSLDPTKTCFTLGMSMGLLVFFTNTGDVDAGSFTLEALVHGQVYTAVIDGLPAGKSSYHWFAESGAAMEVVQITIDSEFDVDENDESNNFYEAILPIPTLYISCTATPTLEGTVTATAEPTITGTPPTPTSSAVPGYHPLTNGGFEDDADSDNVPDGWTGKNLAGAKRVCKIAYEGGCAFQFKAGSSGKLIQKVNIEVDQAFDHANFSAWVQVKKVSQGALKGKAKLVFGDEGSLVLELNDPTHDGVYYFVSDSAPLDGTVTKVVVSFRLVGGLNGKVRIDNVMLSLD